MESVMYGMVSVMGRVWSTIQHVGADILLEERACHAQ